MIIAPIVEKNKPLCPCQCKNSNEYMHIKKIDTFYSIDGIYETIDYRERCEPESDASEPKAENVLNSGINYSQEYH